jgi:hypothetical protein
MTTVGRRLIVCALVAVASGGALGCGYSLAGRGSFLPSYVQTIGVPTFVNRTRVYNVEIQLTQKVRAEFIGRGKYKIVPEDKDVDAVLIGEVVAVDSVPAAFDDQRIATRYTLIMTARVQLRSLSENKVLWENQNLIFRDDYDVQTGTGTLDPAAFFGQDANALERMTTSFARNIVTAILEAF